MSDRCHILTSIALRLTGRVVGITGPFYAILKQHSVAMKLLCPITEFVANKCVIFALCCVF